MCSGLGVLGLKGFSGSEFSVEGWSVVHCRLFRG